MSSEIKKENVRRPHNREAGVSRCAHAAVFLAKHSQTAVEKRTQNLLGAVGRAVVDNDYLDVLDALRENAFQSFPEIGFGIIGSDHHRDFGQHVLMPRRRGR